MREQTIDEMINELAMHPAAVQKIVEALRKRQSEGAALEELETALLQIADDRDNAYALMEAFGLNTTEILRNAPPAGTA